MIFFKVGSCDSANSNNSILVIVVAVVVVVVIVVLSIVSESSSCCFSTRNSSNRHHYGHLVQEAKRLWQQLLNVVYRLQCRNSVVYNWLSSSSSCPLFSFQKDVQEAKRLQQQLPEGVYRLKCRGCRAPACTSEDIRLLRDTNRVVIGAEFSNKYVHCDCYRRGLVSH